MTDAIRTSRNAMQWESFEQNEELSARAAGILLATVGVLQFLQGIAAIAKDDIIVVGQEYTFSWDVTAWGWVHLILGILVALSLFAMMALGHHPP